MKTLITIFVLIFSSPVFGEVYFCTYEHYDETRSTVLKRDGNHFLDIYEDESEIELKIIKENDDYIHLYNSYIDFGMPMYFAQLIDKKNKTFVMVGLEFNNSTNIIEGPCIVTD